MKAFQDLTESEIEKLEEAMYRVQNNERAFTLLSAGLINYPQPMDAFTSEGKKDG